MRTIFLLLMLVTASARAELTCEQIGATITATIEYRDQGQSLAQVINGVEQLRAARKLTDDEINYLQRVVRAVFLQSSSPREILTECKEEKEREERKKKGNSWWPFGGAAK